MSEEWREQFRASMQTAEEEDARLEAERVIEIARSTKPTPRWLTPPELRKAAEGWVQGRNEVIAARDALRESGIIASMKSQYLVPDTLEEPLYSEVLKVMVEQGEWPTEPETNLPKWKHTPTVNYRFNLTRNVSGGFSIRK